MASNHINGQNATVEQEEHRSIGSVNAKAVVPYFFNGTNLIPSPTALIDVAFDYIGFSNADGNGNYQTWVFKTGGASGTTVRTLSVTYDGSSNITSLARS